VKVPEQALNMVVTFDITAEGDVTKVSLENSAGTVSLDDRAIECAKAWHYKPAVLNGAAVPAHWRVQIEWTIR
jgi:TonB family protein